MMHMEKKRRDRAELICRVREGDQKAFEVLLAEYEPLLCAEVARAAAGLAPEDGEDLRQVALLAFYRAALGFDLHQTDVEFGLYAKICIANALASQMRLFRRRSKEVFLPDAAVADRGEDPAGRVMEEEAAALLHARIRSLLSPLENKVWQLYMSGLRSSEIAERLGREPHSIDNAVYRIRQKLRRALGDRK